MTSTLVSDKSECPLLRWAVAYGDTVEKRSSADTKASNIMIRSFSQETALFEVTGKQSVIGKFFSKIGHFIVNLFRGTHDWDLQFQIKRYGEEAQKQISESEITSFLEKNPKLSPAKLLQNLHELNSYVGTIANKVKKLDPETKKAVEIDALFKSKTEELLKQQLLKQVDEEVSKKIDTSLTFAADGKIIVSSGELQEIKKQAICDKGITNPSLIDALALNKSPLNSVSEKLILQNVEKQLTNAWRTKETPTDLAAKLWNSIDDNFVTSEELKTKFFGLIEVSAQKFIQEEVKKTDFKNLSISIKTPLKGEKADPTLEIVYESKGEKKTLNNFIKELSKKITGPKAEGDKGIEALITKAIQEKTKGSLDRIVGNLREELHSFYYTQSVPHIEIKKDQIPSIVSEYVPEQEYGVLFQGHYEEVPYPLGIDQDCTFSGKTITDQTKDAALKIKNFRDNHLTCVRAISTFILSQGAIFLNSEDQQGVVDNINTIYTLRNEQYFSVNKEVTDAARCIDALAGIKNYVKEISLGIFNHTGTITQERSGPLIILLNEQKKACEKILEGTTNKLVIKHATEAKELCEQVVKNLSKRTEKKDMPADGAVNIHYHGNVKVVNRGAGNVNLGVVYGDIINSGYVIGAEKAQEGFLDSTSASSILQSVFGQTVQGAVSGFIFGGIPTMVTMGVFAATRALVQPLTEYAVKKAGVSGEAAKWIGLMTATAMSTYTSAYVTTYLSGKKIEEVASPTKDTKEGTTPPPVPTTLEKVSSFVSKIDVLGQMKKNLGEGLTFWQGFNVIGQITSPIITTTPTADISKIKEYVFNKVG